MQHKQFILWLDMQLSPKIAKWIIETYNITAFSSYELSFNTEQDEIIFLKAKDARNVILVTKDRDFPELQQRLNAPPKIIWLRIGNSPNKKLKVILSNKLLSAIEELINTDATIVEIIDK
jgi:predicted nuclease of predicted toxin-antitoxin system